MPYISKYFRQSLSPKTAALASNLFTSGVNNIIVGSIVILGIIHSVYKYSKLDTSVPNLFFDFKFQSLINTSQHTYTLNANKNNAIYQSVFQPELGLA